MAKKKFPYQGWILMPSFTLKELTFVKSATMTDDWHASSERSLKYYDVSEIHKTKSEAISAGRNRLEKLRENLKKRAASIEKWQAALDKAE
jgi:hypothetical protein